MFCNLYACLLVAILKQDKKLSLDINNGGSGKSKFGCKIKKLVQMLW